VDGERGKQNGRDVRAGEKGDVTKAPRRGGMLTGNSKTRVGGSPLVIEGSGREKGPTKKRGKKCWGGKKLQENIQARGKEKNVNQKEGKGNRESVV